MNDRFGTFGRPQAHRRIADIAFDELDGAGCERIGHGACVARRGFAVPGDFRQIRACADRQVIEDADGVSAFGDKFADQAGADKVAATGDKPAHQAAFQLTRGITLRVSIRLL